MSKAQLVITAVMLEGRSKSEVARDYDVSRQWVQQLVRRYATEGATAFEPRSRRPTKPTHTCATNNGSVAKLAHWYPFCWRSSLDWHGGPPYRNSCEICQKRSTDTAADGRIAVVTMLHNYAHLNDADN
jgi:Helix-turn-helix domain